MAEPLRSARAALRRALPRRYGRRGLAEVVSEPDRLGQVLVQPERPRDAARSPTPRACASAGCGVVPFRPMNTCVLCFSRRNASSARSGPGRAGTACAVARLLVPLDRGSRTTAPARAESHVPAARGRGRGLTDSPGQLRHHISVVAGAARIMDGERPAFDAAPPGLSRRPERPSLSDRHPVRVAIRVWSPVAQSIGRPW